MPLSKNQPGAAPVCPLCGKEETSLLCRDQHNRERPYFSCPRCSLIFVPRAYHLSDTAERARYDLHNNDPKDEGYREFLSRLINPLMEVLPPNSRGLDFGSGPSPVLSAMMEEEGHRMDIFDPFYAPDETVFTGKYVFITASEVTEHLAEPGRELKRLFSMLLPGGILAIMTKFHPGITAFPEWFYKNDDTHITFYSKETFRWLGKVWKAVPRFKGDRVVLFKKSG